MPAVSLLPLFGSPALGPGASGGPVGGGPLGGVGSRKVSGPSGAFRLTEKFVLLLVFSAFITLCFGAIFFLPDSSKLLSGVLFHSTNLQQQPPPPPAHEEQPPPPQPPGAAGHVATLGGSSSSYVAVAAGEAAENLAKIREEHERALREAKETLQKLPEEIRRDIHQDKAKFLLQDKLSRRGGGAAAALPELPFRKRIGVVGREPTDSATQQKRTKVKEVGEFARISFPSLPNNQAQFVVFSRWFLNLLSSILF